MIAHWPGFFLLLFDPVASFSPPLDTRSPPLQHQSPSPTEEIASPYEVALIRSRSSGRSRSPASPVVPLQSLQRQLSGDADNPPPPWTRRPSINSSNKSVRSPSTVSGKSALDSISVVSASAPPVPPSPGQLAPPSRRHPGLTMTSAASDSPSGSSTSLSNDDLGLPNPAFRRRPGSNRSSMTQSSLTSEELWALEQQANGPPDLSNPMRQAAERPLDTIKRMSRQVERQYSGALPGDVICECTSIDISDHQGRLLRPSRKSTFHPSSLDHPQTLSV